MITILGSLLSGWILGLFGFDSLIITGMAQLFGVTITQTGYYAMFGLLGMMKGFRFNVNSQPLIARLASLAQKEKEKKDE